MLEQGKTTREISKKQNKKKKKKKGKRGKKEKRKKGKGNKKQQRKPARTKERARKREISRGEKKLEILLFVFHLRNSLRASKRKKRNRKEERGRKKKLQYLFDLTIGILCINEVRARAGSLFPRSIHTQKGTTSTWHNKPTTEMTHSRSTLG